MEPLSRKLRFSATLPELPDGFSDELYDLSRSVTSPTMAGEVFEKLQPLLRDYRADRKLALACGLLVARLQPEAEIGAVWNDLRALFPDDATALRMLMRWYRREDRPRVRLEPMGDDMFRVGDLDWFRLGFARNARGKIVKVVGHYDNGRTDENPRD